ncbi:MAG TPA: hypothetical protein VFR58_03175 [Flavisolibacter sp.]|nr:hypothetical protein [Flavisolibacter sp.]
MKKILQFPILLFIFSLLSFSAQSQAAEPSSEGFWVVQHQVKTPRQSVIYFYNGDKQLIYKEEITGVRINLKKRKTVRRLNAVLNEAETAWKQEKALQANTLVMNKFR